MAFSFDGERFRRPPGIWQAGPAMCLVLLGVALIAWLIANVVGLALEGLALNAANVALAALPPALWWALYYRPARRRGKALPHMPGVVLLGGVLANGVALPIIYDIFAVDTWLPNQSGLVRILGYTLIVGFLQEYLKFAALRYTVYPDALVERGDGVAYGVAVALGVATTLNLRLIIDNGAALIAPAAARVASVTLAQMAFGAVQGYFFTMARFSRREPPVWWFAVGVAVTALLNGLYVAFRGGFIVGGFGVGATANTPLLALVMNGAFALGAFGILGFLNRQAETREAAVPGRRAVP